MISNELNPDQILVYDAAIAIVVLGRRKVVGGCVIEFHADLFCGLFLMRRSGHFPLITTQIWPPKPGWAKTATANKLRP